MSQRVEEIREVVRDHYAAAARKALEGKPASCCGPAAAPAASCCGPAPAATAAAPIETGLGCGNPTALADLRPGDVVLDLGSGGGLDVIQSARRVGPKGKAYGLDMTDEMLALAAENKRRSGVTNVEFLKGTIEKIPLPDASVDVIISNCVINLSGDKDAVLREAYRVLKPGGRFAVSDIVIRRELPEVILRSMESWAGCVAGAMRDEEYRAKLTAAGFRDVSLEVTQEYCAGDAREMFEAVGLNVEDFSEYDGAVVSAFVRARKTQ